MNLHIEHGIDDIFHIVITSSAEVVGYIFAYQHPRDRYGAEIHIEILPPWRKKWLSRSLKDDIKKMFIATAKKYELSIVYSTALTPVSPRLLEFFGFTCYYHKQPKTYYYSGI